jgi:pSer/pThr/pTyr-binding forkhead associated (FHA) protein
MKGWMFESSSPAMKMRLPFGVVKTVGRTAPADFILEAPLVSRLHCKLIVSAKGELSIEDIESTNGTLLNGQRIKGRASAKGGDIVTIGRVAFNVSETS